MHSTRYVHRDIKTENLLFMRNGYLKLADFGFAKQLPPGKCTHTSCGTPLYMAPEIIGMKGHSFAVDWWYVHYAQLPPGGVQGWRACPAHAQPGCPTRAPRAAASQLHSLTSYVRRPL